MKVCPQCGKEFSDTTTLCPGDGAALEQKTDSLIGQVLAEKYRIDERLSEGGMGTVYRGIHVLMDKTVAIKVLRPSLAADQKLVARFSREARAASRISHPNALSVTDFGEAEGGIVFLVMEFLSGETLKEVIRREGPLPLSRIIEILRQVGGALDAAHLQGVVHRDLKSENIMLLATNGADYAKVLDFGIAKITEREGKYDPALTAPDLVIGTPQYMSPEQCSQSTNIDARSDIYSLGVILFEMLVGHVPFTGESPTTIMLKHLQEPVPSVLDERPDIPRVVGRIVSQALAKRPEERYQTVSEFIEDLSIAGGMQPAFIPSASVAGSSEAPPVKATELPLELDEETVVRPRQQLPPPISSSGIAQQRMPSTRSFSPWKIMIPSAAGLLVIFAVIYAFTGRSAGTPPIEPTPGSTLTADPNSRPVERARPPTGRDEEGVTSSSANTSIEPEANANTNQEGLLPPLPGTEGAAPNANSGSEEEEKPDGNKNANRASPLPSPSKQIKTEQPVPSPGETTAPAKASPTLPPAKEPPG